MESRRVLLQKLGLGAAAASVGLGASGAARAEQARRLRAFAEGAAPADPPWWLVTPLQTDTRLSDGWVLRDLSPVERGAAVLSLEHRSGATAALHLCAHGGQPRGLASTRLFDLVLMDGGQGDQPTHPGLARVITSLARRIRRNELAAADAGLDSVSRMLSHDERVALYGPESLS